MSKQSQTPFTWRHFQANIILSCVRWYVRYSLSYRDLKEMMWERGLQVDHTAIYRSRVVLRTRIGEAQSALPQADQRLMACRRNLHQGQDAVDVPLQVG